ncbi:B12-binding domain-containing radical SAM protein [Tissierella carlieri]|uniref:B12-binding domain-containing radical SAM protein n=1 Tax=Tissierella carlieri TaxID=689904 RepID=UPI002805FF2C|nr:radical SAM protein [uncultured Tissierella sp.]MDU5080192.1 radical SAM protein [Bacillota bacterium]
MIKNFYMILVADEDSIIKEQNFIGLSLAMGIISSYLRKLGIDTYIHDINQFLMDKSFTKTDKELISLLYDKDRVLSYIYGEEDITLDRIARLFLDQNWKEYDSYGISIGADFSLFQIHLGVIIAKYLKKETKRPVIVGGNNVSYLYIFKDFYHELLTAAIEKLKFIVKGPGEKAIYKIINSIDKGIPEEIIVREGEGLLYLEDGEIKSNIEASPIVICPTWDGLDMKPYSYPLSTSQRENENILYRFPLAITSQVVEFNRRKNRENTLFIPYIFNYNCVYSCAFCTQSDTDRGQLIIGEVERVVQDIEELSKKYNSKYFYFLNNYFPSSLKFIKEFNRLLKERNLEIYWSDCGRVNGMTYEKLKLLYESGCRKLVFGFETGDTWLLEFINKKLDLKELIQVLKWCKEIGIWADLEVIIGLPYERENEFMNTYNFLYEYRDIINNFWLNEYFLIPNSLIGRYPNRYKIELIKDMYNYDMLLNANRDKFLNENISNMTSNSRLWGFNEVKENFFRSYGEMQRENIDKIKRLSELRNPEFNQLFKFYSSMNKIRESS